MGIERGQKREKMPGREKLSLTAEEKKLAIKIADHTEFTEECARDFLLFDKLNKEEKDFTKLKFLYQKLFRRLHYTYGYRTADDV